MKVIVLAAGMSMRFLPLTAYLPKTLIHIDGKSLLERLLDALHQHGITEAFIVIGHLGHVVQEMVDDRHMDTRIKYLWSDTTRTQEACAHSTRCASLSMMKSFCSNP